MQTSSLISQESDGREERVMNDIYDVLEDLCKMVERKLSEASEKARSAGNLSAGDVEYLDVLTHTLKNIKTSMAMIGSSYNSANAYGEGSYDGGSNRSYDGGSNRSYDGGSGRWAYEGGSSRGRGRNANRDSMGRYASRMSNHGMVDELKGLMEDATDERVKQEFRQFINKIENM